MDIVVGPPVVTIHAGDEFLVCDQDGSVDPARQHGYFKADTRLVSEYRMTLSRQRPELLSSSRIEPFSARFEFQNAPLTGPSGTVGAGEIHIRSDRTLATGIHEDHEVVNYSGRALELDLEVFVASDFADLFEVRAGSPVQRGRAATAWDPDRAICRTTYRNGSFVRGLQLMVERSDSPPEFVNGLLSFRLSLPPKARWRTCLLWMPFAMDQAPRRPLRPCRDLTEGSGSGEPAAWPGGRTEVASSDPVVQATLDEAIRELAALRLPVPATDRGLAQPEAGPGARTDAPEEGWVVAAGVPWYVALFGRDTLVTALQTLPLSPAIAVGALGANAALQGRRTDDTHDEQPGRIAHELRVGELAHLGLIPQTPYFGTHDASSLFVLAAGELWRWSGSRPQIEGFRPAVDRALRWIDTDAQVDGLQAYRTRAGAWGYQNQSWRDAFDGVVDELGQLPPLPIATCELQGYVVAAKRRWASVLEEAFDERSAALRLRDQADALQELIEARFWWEDEDTYYLGLDGEGRPIRSVTSNPGHLLWNEAVAPERAQRVAARMLGSDLWSGWGVRTLSSEHRAYNPLSYQRGSVWPHDNAILVAGLMNYGHVSEAHTVLGGLLDAAARFHQKRVPEVFAGLTRDAGSFPVQYIGANVPQAWAAGAIVHAICSCLRLEPDATAGRLDVDPALPRTLGRVTARGLRVGAGSIDLTAQGSRVAVDAVHGELLPLRRGQALVGTPATSGDPGSSSIEPSPASTERKTRS